MNIQKEKEYPEHSRRISQLNELDLSGTYSYADYLRWAFEERVELIRGKIFKMSPAPSRIHQAISREIGGRLFNYLENKNCEVYSAPFDVRLPRKSKNDRDIVTVLQPDIIVICDHSKLDDRGCIGAPDIVVEILSPGNNKKELHYKFEIYEESGVKEYWIVWPESKSFLRYILDENGKYLPSRVMTLGEEVTTPVLPGFTLSLDEVFGDD